jgi:hypothetical protein
MRIDPGEFRARPLRVHAVLHDVPLEDAWAVPLSGGGAGRTVQVTCPLYSATYGESSAGSAAVRVRCSNSSGVRYPRALWGRWVL